MFPPLEPISCPKCRTPIPWRAIKSDFPCPSCHAALISNSKIIWGVGGFVVLMVGSVLFEHMGFWKGLAANFGFVLIGMLVISVFVTVQPANEDAT